MDFFFCLPIIFGCPTKIKPDGDPSPRVCPRCHNASVFQAKSRTWFELCWVPLVPFHSERIWCCSICQWQVPLQQGWEPMHTGANFGVPPQGWQQPLSGPMSPPPSAAAQGYGPTYINHAQK